MRKLTSNKLKITLFQNLLEMNWNELKLIWSNLSEIPLMSGQNVKLQEMKNEKNYI